MTKSFSPGKESNLSKKVSNRNTFNVSNRSTKNRCEICSKLTTKTPEWRQWRRSGVFIVTFEHIP